MGSRVQLSSVENTKNELKSPINHKDKVLHCVFHGIWEFDISVTEINNYTLSLLLFFYIYFQYVYTSTDLKNRYALVVRN